MKIVCGWQASQHCKKHNLQPPENLPANNEPSGAMEDGLSPSVAKQPKLDFYRGRGHQSTSNRQLMAGHVVDEMLTIITFDLSSLRQILDTEDRRLSGSLASCLDDTLK